MDAGRIKSLNKYHVVLLIQQSMVGVGLFSLPHSLTQVGYNQWLMPIIFGLLAQITLYPMYLLGRKYPDGNLFDLFSKLLGKFVGKLMTIFFITYCVLTVSAITERYLAIVQIGTLPAKSIYLPLFTIFVVMIYILRGGIKLIARFAIVTLLLTSWMTFYLQWGLSKGVYSHILPLIDFNFTEFTGATFESYRSMLGYELLLVYFPYIQNPKKVYVHASIGIWITVFFYFAVTLTSAVYFTTTQLEILRYPVLNLYKAVELSFIERIETLGVSIWVFLVLSTTTIFLWSGVKGMESLLNKKRNFNIYLLATLSFLIIWLPIFDQWEAELYDILSINMGYFFILFPAFLLVMELIRSKVVKRDE